MSLDHLKKQAKNLRKLLPEFIAQHTATPSLAACQELIAKSSGYPSWHAAVHAANERVEEGNDPYAGVMRTLQTAYFWRQQEPDNTNPRKSVRLIPKDQPSNHLYSERLFDAIETEFDFDPEQHASTPEFLAYHKELAIASQQIILEAPWYIDAYAQLATSLVYLGKPKAAFASAGPVWESLIKMLPGGAEFGDSISWYELDNRPFHRLCYALASAYLANKAEGQGFVTRAQEVADSLLKWWPNDNIGIRFLREKMP